MPIVNPRRKCGAFEIEHARERIVVREQIFTSNGGAGDAPGSAAIGVTPKAIFDTPTASKVEHVNDALVLNRAVGLDDSAQIDFARASGKERARRGGQLLLIDRDVTVRVSSMEKTVCMSVPEGLRKSRAPIATRPSSRRP
jgi:hypothetical protein